jgi:hypothetical protein
MNTRFIYIFLHVYSKWRILTMKTLSYTLRRLSICSFDQITSLLFSPFQSCFIYHVLTMWRLHGTSIAILSLPCNRALRLHIFSLDMNKSMYIYFGPLSPKTNVFFKLVSRPYHNSNTCRYCFDHDLAVIIKLSFNRDDPSEDISPSV